MGVAADQLGRSAPLSADEAAPLGPYLLFLGETVEPGYAKTAFGLRDWAPERCVGEYALAGATVTTGLPSLTPREAHAKGARALLIGVASPGGSIPGNWVPVLMDALDAGLDIVSGMHARLRDIPELAYTAETLGRRLVDLRVPPAGIKVGTGKKRSGKRLLTVGTDCALGKKYTALSVARGLKARGLDVTFRATGQTGIMIAGAGIPIDAVVSDFVAGAAELLTPDAPPAHIDVIEGQGSLFHPAYASVSLGLLHGSQPDSFIVCHEPGRTHILGYPGFNVPTIEEVITQTIALGKLTNPAIRCAGVSLNTSNLDSDQADRLLAAESDRLGLPVADPVRGGLAFELLLDRCRI
jgi:D-glutamate N-acetyltransferase